MAHRFTRAPLTAMLAALVAAAPLGAQWQGVVTFHNQMSDASGAPTAFQYFAGPSGVAKMVVQDKEHPASIIYNKSANTATMVMPEQQMYMTMSLAGAQAEQKKMMGKMQITPTGKSEVVAGHKCDDYHAVDNEDKTQTDVCIATDMGTFATFDPQHMGGDGGGGAGGALSMLQNLLSAKGGFFPLKATTYKDGKVEDEMVATSIEAKSIPASEFVPPAGYKSMTMPSH